MPPCAIHLISLIPTTSLSHFLSTLSASNLPKPLTISRVIRWIILPTSLSTSSLLARNIHWDLLLILPTTAPLPASLKTLVAHQWTVVAGVPSRLIQDFESKNEKLLRPAKADVPPLTGSLDKPRINSESSQHLEISPELKQWTEEFAQTNQGKGAVSMLNLLAFKPGLKEQYLKYGAEFAASVGTKRGGRAKIVGSVIHTGEETDGGNGWDEIALAHYPTIWHFADMLASEDYQAVNHKYRVGSLKDTFILCTSELCLDTEEQKVKIATNLDGRGNLLDRGKL